MAGTTIKFRDYDNDLKQISIPRAEVTVVGDYPAALTAHTALVDAINAVTLGTIALQAFTPRTIEAQALPASPVAQTNVQWLVTYTDDIDGHVEHLSLPTADIATAALRLPNSSFYDPAHADWIALIAAFEAIAISNLGNAVTVTQIEFKE